MFEKVSVVALDTCRSPLPPLKRGKRPFKVPLFKGDLGGSPHLLHEVRLLKHPLRLATDLWARLADR
ncbi:MAG: hypothetical protein DCF17_19070 [Shackletoniella antarctica]|uniref:Uncharacterized protein n=1 Tax=Shackletoniella antarctica TaxID=268115 RepID=A0A2W4VTF4_9CYAN|nr:MAG: hypothetical protein DCF17_19070 [Shackletoniella antarctica]